MGLNSSKLGSGLLRSHTCAIKIGNSTSDVMRDLISARPDIRDVPAEPKYGGERRVSITDQATYQQKSV